ncbi:hypothetical protein ACFQPF_12480 [Fictibacillus iocasae]|uniref:Group-specific protein n=1 Tax=Fictibacillus iocasae TaxID=2715437 RepID=A0ABW2NSW0_9BACL
MERVTVNEKKLESGLLTFVFPFALKKSSERKLAGVLADSGYTRFDLGQTDLEDAFYGGERVSHRDMEHYFLPFITKFIFPKSREGAGFQRYSKVLNVSALLKTDNVSVPFSLISVDVIVCPFQLGLLSVRTKVEDLPYSEALEFASRFRVLEDRTPQDKKAEVLCDGSTFDQVDDFLFESVVPEVPPFFDFSVVSDSHFETLPYFVDERVYVQGTFVLSADELIENADLFRAGQLDGLNGDGNPRVECSSLDYLARYVSEQCYDRWAPDTYYVCDQHSFCLITTENGGRSRQLASQMYGEYYYGLLINLFYKIVLLKFSNEYSRVKLEREDEKIEDLVRAINHFISKYYFIELAPQTQGREVFTQLRHVFGTRALYEDVKDNLASLFQYQDKFASNRNGHLLTVLTLYTVIGGIYGMNQVIEDLKGNIDWGKMSSYSLFQYIALFVTFSGLLVGAIMTVASLVKWYKEKRRQKEWV